MKGSISNTYTLVPQFQGKYPINAVEFTFFNTSSKKYETLKSKETRNKRIGGANLIGGQ